MNLKVVSKITYEILSSYCYWNYQELLSVVTTLNVLGIVSGSMPISHSFLQTNCGKASLTFNDADTLAQSHTANTGRQQGTQQSRGAARNLVPNHSMKLIDGQRD